MLKMTKLTLNLFQILTCIYSLRMVHQVEFLTFLIDTAKPKIDYLKTIEHVYQPSYILLNYLTKI